MPRDIKKLIKNKSYMRHNKKNYRTSIASTLGNFLMENPKSAYNDDELREVLISLGFQLQSENAVYNGARLFNTRDFQFNHVMFGVIKIGTETIYDDDGEVTDKVTWYYWENNLPKRRSK